MRNRNHRTGLGMWIMSSMLLCVISTTRAQQETILPETPVPLENGSFDHGLKSWQHATRGAKLFKSDQSARLRLDRGAWISRQLSIDRGRITFQGRRVMVRVRAKTSGDTGLRLRLRCEGKVHDTVLRQADDWTDLVGAIDTAAHLPGANSSSLTLELQAIGEGHALIQQVRVNTLAPYGGMLRITLESPVKTTWRAQVRLLRQHRDTSHPDPIRHQFFSTLDAFSQGVAAGQPSDWLDLRPYLFGDGRATLTVALFDHATGQPLTNAVARIELAVPGEQPAKASPVDDPMTLHDDGLQLEAWVHEADAVAPTPRVFFQTTAKMSNGLFTLLVPENQVPPERYTKLVTTIADDVAARLAWMDQVFPAEGAVPRKIIIAANFFSLDDMLNDEQLADEMKIFRRIGISAIARSSPSRTVGVFDAIRRSTADMTTFRDRIYARLGDEVWLGPYAGDALRTRIAQRYQSLAESLKQTGDDKHVALVELMDEPPDYALTEADVPAFRAYLRGLGVTPAQVGVATWDEIEPWPEQDVLVDGEDQPDLPELVIRDVDQPEAQPLDEIMHDQTPAKDTVMVEPGSLEARRLRYHTRRFTAGRTAEIFKIATAAVHASLPDVMTSVNFRSGVRRVLLPETADWFEFGRRKAVTMLWNEDWLNTYGWRRNGIQLVSYYTKLMHAAARPHDLPHGCFVIVMGHTLEKAYSALAHGARRISFWRYGPAYANYLPYSWSHSHRDLLDIATFTRDVAAIEDILVDAKPHRARTALLYAKSDPLWNRSQDENRLVAFALLHDQIPFDIITEDQIEQDDILDGYDTVYVTDVSVREQTQKRLAQWVRLGGAIWLSGDAASRDELDEPTTTLRGPMAGGDQHEDAYQQNSLGQGRFRLMNNRPGERYEAPVRAMFNRERGKGRIQTGWPEAIRQTITDFVPDDADHRPVKVSLPCVEAQFYRHPKSDLLFLIDYTGQPGAKTLNITVRDANAVRRIESLRHGELPFTQDGDNVKLTVELDRADTLRLHHE